MVDEEHFDEEKTAGSVHLISILLLMLLMYVDATCNE